MSSNTDTNVSKIRVTSVTSRSFQLSPTEEEKSSEVIQLIEKHVNASPDQNAINILLQSSSIKPNDETRDLLQNDIKTIEEVNFQEDNELKRNQSDSENREEREDNQNIIEDLKKRNRSKCSTCCSDVFHCVTWYFRSIKNCIISCCRGDCNCETNNSYSSRDLDVNYIYDDQNEAFNYDNDDSDIKVDGVETAEGIGDDIYNESQSENVNSRDDAYENVSSYVSDTGNDNSGGDTGNDYSGGDVGGDYSGGNDD